MNKRALGITIMTGVLLLGGALVIKRKMALRNLPPPDNRPIPVQTVPVRDGSVSTTLDTLALIQSDLSATLSAQVSGSLVEVRVREGDSVRRGQILARIDPRNLQDGVEVSQARLLAAQEELVKQQAIHERDKALFEGSAISRQSFEISRSQLESARAAQVAAERAHQTARTTLGYASITAPFDGIIRSRMAEPGDLATPGKPLLSIQSPGPVKVISKLSQESLARLSPGAEVSFMQGREQVKAKVTRIYPALDSSRLGSVETVLKESPFHLPSGSTVHALYAARPARGLVVPTAGLLQGLTETVVVRVREGRADPVPITILSRNASEAAISASLAPGERIVVGPPSELMALTRGTPLQSEGGQR